MLKALSETGGRRLRGLSVLSRKHTLLPSASTQALSGFKFKEIPSLLTGSQTREAAPFPVASSLEDAFNKQSPFLVFLHKYFRRLRNKQICV